MKNLFWKLYNSHFEIDINKIIKENKLMLDQNNWQPYGDSKGNFGTFESQQYHPVPALIEKITNSIDAILIKECRKNGIDPKSKNAPNSMKKAVELFYKVKDGEIGELDSKSRRTLAENIQILAIGDKSQPSIVIYDDGEGQTPELFESTFLSLHANNKTNIHFVQGKYNMGSTGAVVFCGENKYQLIASKRSVDMQNNSKFAFTLVRRHPLTRDEEYEYGKATWYEYFAPNHFIPSFEIDSLDLGLFNREFKSGSIVKLYSYQLPRGSRSDITLDLWRDLNQYMFNLPLPVLLYEKRDYEVKTPSKLLLGNRTRIAIDDRSKVEKIIQFSVPRNSEIGELDIEVIVLDKKVDHKEFINHKSIIFTLNGQVHGFDGQTFISQELGYSLLKKDMLIHVDCTKLPTSIRQDLFMSNRTHLKHGPKTEKLMDVIIDLLRKSEQLKQLNNERRDAIFHDDGSDKELLTELLSKLPVDKDIINLLKKNGALNFLKVKGNRIKPEQDIFKKKLNRFPSIFKLQYNDNGSLYKTIPLNSYGKVIIETDVEDDYLFRPYEKGQFEIEILQKRGSTDQKIVTPDQNPNDVADIISVEREGPTNGTIKLIIKPNEYANVGDEIEIKAKLSTPGDELSCMFTVRVDEKVVIVPPKEEKNNSETFPDMPTPKKSYEKPENGNGVPWSELNWTGNDIVKVINSSDSDSSELFVEGIIVNMDAFVLKQFISKNRIKSEKELKYITDKYFLSIYLHSLFLFSILQRMRKEDETLKPIEMEEFIASMVKPYSNFLLYENYHITKMAFDE
jgi:hypothetical protein